jgi:hypothetical protein
MARSLARIRWSEVAGLLAIAAVILALWDTPVVYPLKILVVFFHELSHGLMAVLTGGEIREIEVVAAQGGHCITAGGSRIMTLTAGYLGSMVWGGVILLIAARTRFDRPLMAALAVMLVTITLLFVRPFAGFGFGFGCAAACALALMSAFLPARACDLVLRVIGLTNCLYAIADIKSDVLDRPELRSDAAMLAEITHMPTVVWGVVWISLATIGGLVFLILASRRPPEPGLAGLRKRSAR